MGKRTIRVSYKYDKKHLGEVYKITKELVNANEKTDPPILKLNGNILSTDEDKLNRRREHFESMLNHVVSSDVAPFAPTTEPISSARSIPQTLSSKSEMSLPSNLFPLVKPQELMEYKQSSTNLTLTWQLNQQFQPILEVAWLCEAFPEE